MKSRKAKITGRGKLIQKAMNRVVASEPCAEIRKLREALLLYHEAWNGCESDWLAAMREASKNAEAVLWPNKQSEKVGQQNQEGGWK